MTDDDEKILEGSDPKTDHASALELVGEFYLNGDVSNDSMLKLSQSMYRVAQLKTKRKRAAKPTLTLNINTPGGGVQAGLMLGAVLDRARAEFGVRIVTRALSQASSMGFIIMQFGDHRVASPYAQFMIHDVQAMYWGDSDERRRREKMLVILRNTVANILAERNTAGHNDPKWWLRNYMEREEYMSAEEALAMGVIDEIVGGPARKVA